MSDAPGTRRSGRVAVLSGSWGQQGEQAAAVRSIAGALSRSYAVDVLVPPDQARADGAFEALAFDDAARDPAYRWVIVDAGDARAADRASDRFPHACVVGVGCQSPRPKATGGDRLAVLDVGFPAGAGTSAPGKRLQHHVGLYARVHPYAAERPHLSLGSVSDYLLVLGTGAGMRTVGDRAAPSVPVAWIAARFPRRYVVALEGAVAQIWRTRSCVGSFEVHTRMDLWRLLAHAQATVDLAPGTVYARECVESLRYGTPVIARAGSPADALVAAGSGLGYAGTSELLDAVSALADPLVHASKSGAGREAVEHWYGDPRALVSRVMAALEGLIDVA